MKSIYSRHDPGEYPCECGDRDELRAEVEEWVTRCRNLTDPNPGEWTEALHEAREALNKRE